MARAAKLDLRLFQQELATRLASKTTAQVESSRLGLACAGEQWLIRLADAGEVIAVPAYAAVPLTKRWFLGVANLRGNLYSVIDLASFIGRETVAAPGTGGQARMVVFGPRTGDLKAGVVVQRVLGLRNLAELAPSLPPADAPGWYGQRWMDADGGTWQEIDLAKLAHNPAFLQAGL
jgi:twitching motility protein PilI